jgi:hypothetical protein
MPLGRRASDATTPYLVYEFLYNGKVFYVGVAHGNIRHTRRWGHIANLVRHEQAGSLKPIKAHALNQKSNAVLATLIRAGLAEHQWRVVWQGEGKNAAETEEKMRIARRLDEGCILANIQHNPKNSDATVDQIIDYLSVKLLSSTTALPSPEPPRRAVVWRGRWAM